MEACKWDSSLEEGPEEESGQIQACQSEPGAAEAAGADRLESI